MLEVKRLRQEREWNQTELAYHAGLAPSVISQIENGKRDPSARTLRKLAEALGVEVGDLFPKAQAPLPLEPEAVGLTAADPSGKLTAAAVLEEIAELWTEQLARGFYDRRTLNKMRMAGFVLAANHEAEAREYRETLPPHFRAQLEAAEERFAAVGAQLWDLEEVDREYPVPPEELALRQGEEHVAKREELLQQLRGGGQAQHA